MKVYEIEVMYAGSRGICSHIPRAHAAQSAKIDAYNLIERALDPYHWFHNWVRDHNSHLGRVEDYGLKMTKLRKRWLDQLIADCEAAL